MIENGFHVFVGGGLLFVWYGTVRSGMGPYDMVRNGTEWYLIVRNGTVRTARHGRPGPAREFLFFVSSKCEFLIYTPSRDTGLPVLMAEGGFTLFIRQ